MKSFEIEKYINTIEEKNREVLVKLIATFNFYYTIYCLK